MDQPQQKRKFELLDNLAEVAYWTQYAVLPKKRSIRDRTDFMVERCQEVPKHELQLKEYFDNYANNWFINDLMEIYLSDENTGQLQIYVNNNYLFVVITDGDFITNYINDKYNTTNNYNNIKNKFNNQKFEVYCGKMTVNNKTISTRKKKSNTKPGITTRFRPLN